MSKLIGDVSTRRRADVATLEGLLGRWELQQVLDMLAEACSARADHFQDVMGDDDEAAYWDRAAGGLLALSGKVG